jgi:hypothetical protein
VSIFYLPDVPDWAVAQDMTVYTNPLLTEPRYRPGLEGVAASLPRLAEVASGRDWQTLSSVLGDMATCLGIEAAEVPHRDQDFGPVSVLYFELEDAVQAGRRQEAHEVLLDMLKAMGLVKKARAPRPLKQHPRTLALAG